MCSKQNKGILKLHVEAKKNQSICPDCNFVPPYDTIMGAHLKVSIHLYRKDPVPEILLPLCPFS